MNQDIKKIPTHLLVDELSKRAGVEKITVEPYQDKTLEINGPAIILKVVD